MGRITQIAAIETTTAIWEYDPDLPNNRIMNGSLDAVAALRTLAVKVGFNLLDLFIVLSFIDPSVGPARAVF